MEKQQYFRYTSNTASLEFHFAKNCAPATADFTFTNITILLKKTAELCGLSVEALDLRYSEAAKELDCPYLNLSEKGRVQY